MKLGLDDVLVSYRYFCFSVRSTKDCIKDGAQKDPFFVIFPIPEVFSKRLDAAVIKKRDDRSIIDTYMEEWKLCILYLICVFKWKIEHVNI